MSKNKLMEIYKEWIQAGKEAESNNIPFYIDCGRSDVREDFSCYAGLKDDISFSDMLQLEERYKLELV